MTLYVPLGERKGRLWWETRNGTLQGVLDILGHENPVSGRLLPGNALELSGSVRTLMREIAWSAAGQVQDGRLSLTLTGPRPSWKLEGTEAPEPGQSPG